MEKNMETAMETGINVGSWGYGFPKLGIPGPLQGVNSGYRGIIYGLCRV